MNVTNVLVDEKAVYIKTSDGRVFNRQFEDFPILRNATFSQRADFQWGKSGIRWPEIDEDLSYAGFVNPVKNPYWV